MKDNKTLNDKINDLEQQINWFYSDDFELEEATKKYKSAIKLARELQRDLDDLQNEIEVLKEDFGK